MTSVGSNPGGSRKATDRVHAFMRCVIPLRGMTAAGTKCESTGGLSLESLARHSREGGNLIVILVRLRHPRPFNSSFLFEA